MSHTEITQVFGASVRRLRAQLGISQEELAERADLHRTYIAGIESGVRNLTLKSMSKLAQALGVPTATLVAMGAPDSPGEAGSHPSTCPGAGRILLVEDSQDDRELALKAFREARVANPIDIAVDGIEALDYLFCIGRHSERDRQDAPQLVLLDLKMPRLGGLDVLRRLKQDERTRSIPVAVITASRDLGQLADCLRLGAHTHITKPVDFKGLSEATRRLNLSWTLQKSPADPRGR